MWCSLRFGIPYGFGATSTLWRRLLSWCFYANQRQEVLEILKSLQPNVADSRGPDGLENHPNYWCLSEPNLVFQNLLPSVSGCLTISPRTCLGRALLASGLSEWGLIQRPKWCEVTGFGPFSPLYHCSWRWDSSNLIPTKKDIPGDWTWAVNGRHSSLTEPFLNSSFNGGITYLDLRSVCGMA